MCGIIGAAGLITTKEEKAVKDMLIFDEIRGVDSVGLAGVNRHTKKVTIEKSLLAAYDFVTIGKVQPIFSQVLKCLIGHNRAATKGTIIEENAHPFQHGHITGVHNGTLTAQHLLADYKKFDVDSSNIYHHMSIHGVEDTWKNLCGAAALVWYDENEDTLNMLRNDKRPLYYMLDKEKKVVFWASEPFFIHAACWRNKIPCMKACEVKENVLYSWNLSNGLKLTTKKLTPCSYTPPVQTTYIHQGWHNWERATRKAVGNLRTYREDEFTTVKFHKRESTYGKNVDYFGEVIGEDIEARHFAYGNSDVPLGVPLRAKILFIGQTPDKKTYFTVGSIIPINQKEEEAPKIEHKISYPHHPYHSCDWCGKFYEKNEKIAIISEYDSVCLKCLKDKDFVSLYDSNIPF